MPDVEQAIAAEAAALRAQRAARMGRGVPGIDMRRYAKFKRPGLHTARMFYDPCCMLKDADARRASGEQYIWRKPDDAYTKSMCLRGTLRPVLTEELDPQSPYANVDRVKIITKNGPREVVRTPGGLGLFVSPPADKLSPADMELLPGEHWEAQYVNDRADSADEFSSDLENLSKSSVMGRVKGGVELSDTQREAIA